MKSMSRPNFPDPRWLLLLGGALWILAGGARGEVVDPEAIRAAMARSLPLIQKSAAIAVAERSHCFTCHHSGLPVLAGLAAKEQNWPVDEAFLQSQVRFTAGILEKNREGYAAGRGPGGQAFGAASALWTLALAEWPADATTDAVAAYILGHRPERDFWAPPSIRPPAEESPFSNTFVVLASLKAYGRNLPADPLRDRLDRAAAWLRATPARSTEDRVFRLWSLATLGQPPQLVEAAARELLDAQRDDGGWAQLEDMAPDAYATGTALVALHRTGQLKADSEAYGRGVRWLLKYQLPDGSWQVASRAKPFQEYFESGYPHGKDQFLSITAACWTTAALALALPEGG